MLKVNRIKLVKDVINELIFENETSKKLGKMIYEYNTLKLLRLKDKILDEIRENNDMLREFIRISTVFSTTVIDVHDDKKTYSYDLMEIGKEITKNYYYTLYNIVRDEDLVIMFPNTAGFVDEVLELEFVVMFLINMFYDETSI